MPTVVIRGKATLNDGSVAYSPTRTIIVEDGPPALPFPPMGVDWSTAANPEPNYEFAADARARRVYAPGQAIACYNSQTVKPLVIALSADNDWSRTNATATANSLRTFMTTWNSVAARRNVRIEFSPTGNEGDREFTTTLPANVVAMHKACWDVANETNADGSLKFPNLKIGVNLTTWNIQDNDSHIDFQAVAPYCHFLSFSGYPTGRSADPVVWTPYANYLEPGIEALKHFRSINPNCNSISIWEHGSPIDHAQDSTGGPNQGGTTNWTIRPRYFAGGRDSTGKNWEGYYNYFVRRCVEEGIAIGCIIYWNRMDNEDIPNPLKHDRPGFWPGGFGNLALAIHDWHPVTNPRLPDA